MVLKKLKGMHDVAIMNLQRVDDLKMITILKVLNLMTVPFLELCLFHRSVLDSSPAGAFVLLGPYLICERGMLSEGFRMGQLAYNTMSRNLHSSAVDAVCSSPISRQQL